MFIQFLKQLGASAEKRPRMNGIFYPQVPLANLLN